MQHTQLSMPEMVPTDSEIDYDKLKDSDSMPESAI